MSTQNPRRSARTTYPVAPPGSLQAGRRLSAGECDDVQVNKVKVIQTNMLAALNSDDTITGRVEELASMRSVVQRSLRKLDKLQDYREMHPGWDVQVSHNVAVSRFCHVPDSLPLDYFVLLRACMPLR